jgi:hypothetical protein
MIEGSAGSFSASLKQSAGILGGDEMFTVDIDTGGTMTDALVPNG